MNMKTREIVKAGSEPAGPTVKNAEGHWRLGFRVKKPSGGKSTCYTVLKTSEDPWGCMKVILSEVLIDLAVSRGEPGEKDFNYEDFRCSHLLLLPIFYFLWLNLFNFHITTIFQLLKFIYLLKCKFM